MLSELLLHVVLANCTPYLVGRSCTLSHPHTPTTHTHTTHTHHTTPHHTHHTTPHHTTHTHTHHTTPHHTHTAREHRGAIGRRNKEHVLLRAAAQLTVTQTRACQASLGPHLHPRLPGQLLLHWTRLVTVICGSPPRQ